MGRIKGYKHSEKTKIKMSLKKKGKIPKNLNWLLKDYNLRPEIREKRSALGRGEKNHSWKGGVTSLSRQIRRSFKYRQWRSDVFTRDDFSCILCRKRGGRIEADHFPVAFSIIRDKNKIKTINDALNCEELWNINNGRTLCVECHNKNKKNWKIQSKLKF